jgi:tyrosine-protein phosphatase YwqE
MIDLHAHILPRLDDGAESLEESVEMCRISYRDGVRTIVATPHILPGVYKNNRSTILAKTQELNEAIRKFGVGSSEFGVKDLGASTPPAIEKCRLSSEYGVKDLDSNVSSSNSELPAFAETLRAGRRTHHSELPFVVLPGADVHFSPNLVQLCENGEIVTVNDDGRYLMVEFDFMSLPYQGEEVLFQLISRGIIPVITHPERNLEIARHPKRYYRMVNMGCLGQVTAMSLTGGFGAEVKRVADRLLAHRLIHFIASDTHSVHERPPLLSPAVREAEKKVGREEAQKMVTEYPQALLEGRRPDVPGPRFP